MSHSTHAHSYPDREQFPHIRIHKFVPIPTQIATIADPKNRHVATEKRFLTSDDLDYEDDDELICTRIPLVTDTTNTHTAECILYKNTITNLCNRPGFNPLSGIESPSPEVYEIRQSQPGGFGMFARKMLYALLLAERPLMIVPWPEAILIPNSSKCNDYQKMQAIVALAVDRMGTKNENLFMNLHHNGSATFPLADIWTKNF